MTPLRNLHRVLVLTALITMPSCTGRPDQEDWTMFKNSPDHVGFVRGRLQPPLRVKWRFANERGFVPGPVVRGGVLFCGSDDHAFYAIDAKTGTLKWKFPTDGEVECPAAVSGGSVFFGSYDGVFYCVDAESGEPRWTFRTGTSEQAKRSYMKVESGIESPPVVVDGVVYFGALDGGVYALRAADGGRVWEYQTRGTIHGSGPAIVDERLYIGSTDGTLHCLDRRDGRVVWTRKLVPSHIDHMMSPPTVHEGVVYVGGGWEGSLFALDAQTGKTRWTFEAASLVAGSPTVAYGKVYVFTARKGTVHAVDVRTGRPVWSRQFPKGWAGCSPIACDGLVWVAMRDGEYQGKRVGLAALDAETGNVVWSYPAGNVWSGVTIAQGMVYVACAPGGLWAFEMAEP